MSRFYGTDIGWAHNKCTAFHVQICRKITNNQHHFVQTFHAKFHTNPSDSVFSNNTSSLRLFCMVCVCVCIGLEYVEQGDIAEPNLRVTAEKLAKSCTTYCLLKVTLCKTAQFLKTANTFFVGFNSGWGKGTKNRIAAFC